MADTPRVTVPVEPTEAMINHAVGHIGGGSTFDTDDRREIAQSVYRAMLSAAPAPEGGAVDVDSAPNFGFETNEPTPRQMVEHYYRSHNLENWQRLADQYCAALATREEAPAEAWKRCASCGAGPAGNCGYYDCETPRNTCPLRAQPQGLTATQLADAIDCFWNAAMGAAREHQTGTSAEVASVVAQGMAAIAQRLRENSNG